MKTFLEKLRSHRSALHWVIFSVITLGSLALYFTARTGSPGTTLVILGAVILANILAMVV
jgi:hypothetical protein